MSKIVVEVGLAKIHPATDRDALLPTLLDQVAWVTPGR